MPEARAVRGGCAVESDSAPVGHCLHALLAALREGGGHMHGQARLRARAGQLSVHCAPRAAAAGALLFELPPSLLVPLAGVTWDGDATMLAPRTLPAGMDEAQRRLLRLQLDLYNACGKLAWAREHLPAAALRGRPALRQAVRRLCPGFDTPPTDAEAFLASRAFRLPVTTPGCTPALVLMPLAELVNHHRAGALLQHDLQGLRLALAQPAGDDECFVQYGRRRDPLDLALHYGFADAHSPLAYSAPVEVQLPGLGRLRVAAQRRQATHALDPPNLAFDAQGCTLSHLVCDRRHPQRFHVALRLALAAAAHRHNMAAAQAARLADQACESLYRANLELLQAVRALGQADALPAAAALAQACELRAATLRHVMGGAGCGGG